MLTQHHLRGEELKCKFHCGDVTSVVLSSTDSLSFSLSLSLSLSHHRRTHTKRTKRTIYQALPCSVKNEMHSVFSLLMPSRQNDNRRSVNLQKSRSILCNVPLFSNKLVSQFLSSTWYNFAIGTGNNQDHPRKEQLPGPLVSSFSKMQCEIYIF